MRNSARPLPIIIFITSLLIMSGPAAPARGQDIYDGSMVGANPQRTSSFKTRGVHQLSQQLWKSARLFNNEARRSLRRMDIATPYPGSSYVLFSPYTYRSSYADFSEPIFSGGTVYCAVTADAGYVFAFDGKSGQEKWRFKLDYLSVSDPTAAGDTVYVGAQRDFFAEGDARKKASLYALDVGTGKERWRFTTKELGFEYASPIYDNGVVYFTGLSGSLYALDARTGQERWVFQAKGPTTYPTLYEGVIYFRSENGYLYAVDIKTGQERWKVKSKAIFLAIADGTIYALDEKENLSSMEAGTGQQKLSYKTSAKVGSVHAVADKVIYFGGAKDSVYAIDANTGQEKWRFKTTKPCNRPVVADGVVYFGCVDKNLYAVDARTGQEKWKIESAKYVPLSPVVADGVVYFINEGGYIYAMR